MKFKSYIIEAGYDIPLSDVTDINSFKGAIPTKDILDIFNKVSGLKGKPSSQPDILLIGNSDGGIKIRVKDDASVKILQPYLTSKGWSKKQVQFGSGTPPKKSGGISWPTPLLETVQCVGVYINGADIIKDFSKVSDDLSILKSAADKWTAKIETVLNNGEDWDAKGVSALKSNLSGDMTLSDWMQVAYLISGMSIFMNKVGKNIKGNKHIIHGRIDDYYDSEEANVNVDKVGSKSNTSDMIISNASASDLIGAMAEGTVDYDNNGVCVVNGISFLQVSLKKKHGGAQLGKVLGAIQQKYDIPSYADLFDIVISEGFLKTLKGKVVGLVKNIVNSAQKFTKSITGYVTKRFAQQQKKDLKFLEGKMGLKEGYLDDFAMDGMLLEKRQYISDKLKNITPSQISILQKEVNVRVIGLNKTAAATSHVSLVKEGNLETPNKLTTDEAIKLFANFTTFYILDEMIAKSGKSSKAMVDSIINIQKEMVFGKTMLPVYKVYGGVEGDHTYEYLNSGKKFVDDKQRELQTGESTIVMGIELNTKSTKVYYVASSAFLLGVDEVGNPEYSLQRMGTNASGKFAYTFEGTKQLSYDQFKSKFTK